MDAGLTTDRAQAFGDVICSGLDDGFDADVVARAIRLGEPRLDEDGAETLVDMAIDTYCPQHQS